jgi:hypothetical protein
MKQGEARRLRSTVSKVLTLVYDPPADVHVSLYEGLRSAVERELEQEIAAIGRELDAARRGGLGADLGALAAIDEDLGALRRRLRALREAGGGPVAA